MNVNLLLKESGFSEERKGGEKAVVLLCIGLLKR